MPIPKILRWPVTLASALTVGAGLFYGINLMSNHVNWEGKHEKSHDGKTHILTDAEGAFKHTMLIKYYGVGTELREDSQPSTTVIHKYNGMFSDSYFYEDGYKYKEDGIVDKINIYNGFPSKFKESLVRENDYDQYPELFDKADKELAEAYDIFGKYLPEE